VLNGFRHFRISAVAIPSPFVAHWSTSVLPRRPSRRRSRAVRNLRRGRTAEGIASTMRQRADRYEVHCRRFAAKKMQARAGTTVAFLTISSPSARHFKLKTPICEASA